MFLWVVWLPGPRPSPSQSLQDACEDTGQSRGRWPAPPQDPRQTGESGRQLRHLDLMLPPNQDHPFLPSPRCLYPFVPIHLLSSLPLFPPPPPLVFPLSSVPSRLPLLSLCDSLSQMTSPATDFSVSDLASSHAVEEAPAGRTGAKLCYGYWPAWGLGCSG